MVSLMWLWLAFWLGGVVCSWGWHWAGGATPYSYWRFMMDLFAWPWAIARAGRILRGALDPSDFED
jgi:hypothetical protein